MKQKFERPASGEFEHPEFEHLPYPLTPPEDIPEVSQEISGEEASLILTELLLDLHELVEKWRTTSFNERSELSASHAPHAIPLEYRAGMADGVENAARDLGEILNRVRC